MERNPFVFQLYPGLGVGCDCRRQGLSESGLEMEELFEPSPELSMYSRPGNRRWLAKGM